MFRKEIMAQEFDLKFYNAVKARFVAKRGTALFISATSENIDDLVPQLVTEDTRDKFDKIMNEHCDSARAYFVIDYLGQKDCIFFYACKEFAREEDYDSGKLLWFRLNPFEKHKVDIEALKREFAQLDQILKEEEPKAS